VDELIRDRMHEALEVEPPPFGLRARVVGSIPMDGSSARRPSRRSFQWAGQLAPGLVAILLAVAVVASLLYVRGAVISPSHHVRPHAAPNARVMAPRGVLVTSDGTVFFSDFISGYVFRLESNGSLVIVAGRSQAAMLSEGSAGDNGPATGAYLFGPGGLAADRNGNLFVADFVGERVRRIDRHGVITTMAGSGRADLPSPNLSGDGGPATAATLNGPAGLAFDPAGVLYVGDSGNHRVRRIDANGKITSLDLSSWSNSNLWSPGGLAFDGAGNLYVADHSGCQVVRVGAGNLVSVVAGTGSCGYGGDGGPASSAQLDGPLGIAFDPAGNLFIADNNNHRIRRVDVRGIMTTVAGTGAPGYAGDSGQATEAETGYPYDVAVTRAGVLYIAESDCFCVAPTSAGRLRMVQLSSGTITTAAYSGSLITS
jgi:DNA-binding beta-propeller fold protein YncE